MSGRADVSRLCRWFGVTEDRAMDEFQERALVSDGAVHLGDVAECDAERAAEWMSGNRGAFDD